MTVYFSLITHDGNVYALFKDKITDAPVDAASLELPEEVTPQSVEGYDVTLGAPQGIDDFLLGSVLQGNGFLNEGSAALMLEKIGVKVDLAAGHDSPLNNPLGISKGDRVKSLGNGLVMVTRQQDTRPYQAPTYLFSDADEVHFKAIALDDDGRMVVRVGIVDIKDEDETSVDDLASYTDAPSFLHEDGGFCYSTLSLEDTVTQLKALGWIQSDKPFIGYMPHELSFGIYEADEEFGFDGPTVFMSIITPHPIWGDHPPFEDDLRPYHLIDCPDFIRGDLMENTFEIDPSMNRDAIMKALIARGYVYDPANEDMM